MQQKYQLLAIENWPRKQHYEFYQTFEQPYFQIACDLNATVLRQYCQSQQLPFFSAYLFLTLKTINQVKAFCYRMVNDEVRVYEQVTISVTVMAPDQTLRFCHLPYQRNFNQFCQSFNEVKDKAIQLPFMTDDFAQEQAIKGTVYMSIIPWFSFTGYSHAIHSKDNSGIPRMVFGKVKEADGTMPFCIDAHHALVDGIDAARFVETLQGYFDSPEKALS